MPAQPASWSLADLGLDRPNAARMYDYLLGGSHNFAADRQAADAVLAVAPEVGVAARANRAFLRRAVRYALDEGVRQFIDLGSGIPTVGCAHEVAQGFDPESRTVYVDVEPVTIAHARTLLRGNPNADVVEADICFPDMVLRDQVTRRLIDFTQPVAVLCVAVLHFIPGDVDLVLAPFRSIMSPGSVLAISHATSIRTTAQTIEVERLYQRTPTPLQLRRPDEVLALFQGLDLAPSTAGSSDAGLVTVAEWRTDIDGSLTDQTVASSPFIAGFLVGVATKPAPTTAAPPP